MFAAQSLRFSDWNSVAWMLSLKMKGHVLKTKIFFKFQSKKSQDIVLPRTQPIDWNERNQCSSNSDELSHYL
jgi:hypothetical protein